VFGCWYRHSSQHVVRKNEYENVGCEKSIVYGLARITHAQTAPPSPRAAGRVLYRANDSDHFYSGQICQTVSPLPAIVPTATWQPLTTGVNRFRMRFETVDTPAEGDHIDRGQSIVRRDSFSVRIADGLLTNHERYQNEMATTPERAVRGRSHEYPLGTRVGTAGLLSGSTDRRATVVRVLPFRDVTRLRVV
jgi:hypothetical protein